MLSCWRNNYVSSGSLRPYTFKTIKSIFRLNCNWDCVQSNCRKNIFEYSIGSLPSTWESVKHNVVETEHIIIISLAFLKRRNDARQQPRFGSFPLLYRPKVRRARDATSWAGPSISCHVHFFRCRSLRTLASREAFITVLLVFVCLFISITNNKPAASAKTLHHSSDNSPDSIFLSKVDKSMQNGIANQFWCK